MPLEIRESEIEGAGMGVFTTDLIPKGRIVLNYLGEITTQEATKYTDSLFALGFIHNQALFISPQEYSNSGRFINTSSEPNCGARISVLRSNFDRPGDRAIYEIVAYVYSLKDIPKGAEITYNYGRVYDL